MFKVKREGKPTKISIKYYSSPVAIRGNLKVDAPDGLLSDLDKELPSGIESGKDYNLGVIARILELQMNSAIEYYLYNRGIKARVQLNIDIEREK